MRSQVCPNHRLTVKRSHDRFLQSLAALRWIETKFLHFVFSAKNRFSIQVLFPCSLDRRIHLLPCRQQ